MANHTGKGCFRPGKSGNPKGRKPREREFTTFIKRAGKVTALWEDGNKSRAEILAELVWQGLMAGEIVLPGGVKLALSSGEWKDLAKWLYSQVDGPPRLDVDLTTEGKAVTSHLTESERIARLTALLDKARSRFIEKET